MDDRSSSSNRQSPWLPFESRRRARDEKREAVLRTAVQLFLEQGYHRTTLNEVAERLNITKPALYNYFRGKDEILFECWAIGNERVADCINDIASGGGTGLAKLRKLIVSYAEVMTTDYGKSLVRFDVRDLTEHNRKIVNAAKRQIDRAFRDYIAEGIADGTIQPCDPKMSAFAIAGSLNWIGHWFEPDGPMMPDDIAEEFAIRLTEGIATVSKPKKADQPPGKNKTSREDRDEHHARVTARATGQSKRARRRLR
ncbi:TetR/AcrR family transcriptional regulator [Bradyrhizobium liaoningense]|uniref:TetR/AcrR family transcriptional regulator n=1 Tax=Bradyrhizobium liaoningense TaxID=43992 RepID=UPI001BA93036|nr:TetR/AcrR family transcriptional regulator [Bradyrhizobium liaoningense]MBR0858035.1 TetR family transcriptional regulator [Bradyrhizobium liaoningense]